MTHPPTETPKRREFDDEEALLRVLSGNGAQVRPAEERSDERT